MAFGTLPDRVRHQRFAAGAFPRRLRAWRERNNLSQREGRRRNYRFLSERCKSGSKIELCRAALPEPQSKNQSQLALTLQLRFAQSSFSRLAIICSRRGSRNGGKTNCSPSVDISSSIPNPGPSVAISNRTPFGSRNKGCETKSDQPCRYWEC